MRHGMGRYGVSHDGVGHDGMSGAMGSHGATGSAPSSNGTGVIHRQLVVGCGGR